CWRHEHHGIVQRPSWADAPRLVVLAPSEADSEKAIPRVWGYIHHPSLLLRTHNLLRRRQGRPVRVPEDVQELVDGMIDDDELNPELPDQDLDRQAADMAHTQLGNNAAIPPPRREMRDLYQLTDHDLDDAQVATRFAADSARVVCCYVGPEGDRWLDTALSERLPSEGELPHGRFTEDQVRAVLSRSLPVPGNWLQGHEEQVAPPEAWQFNPHLRHVQLLLHRVVEEAGVQGPQLGKRRLRFAERVGLLADRSARSYPSASVPGIQAWGSDQLCTCPRPLPSFEVLCLRVSTIWPRARGSWPARSEQGRRRRASGCSKCWSARTSTRTWKCRCPRPQPDCGGSWPCSRPGSPDSTRLRTWKIGWNGVLMSLPVAGFPRTPSTPTSPSTTDDLTCSARPDVPGCRIPAFVSKARRAPA